MGFKDILLQIDDSRGRDSRLNLAVDIARRQGAQLTGLFALEPLDLSGLVAPSSACAPASMTRRAAPASPANGVRSRATRPSLPSTRRAMPISLFSGRATPTSRC